jgi:hypothetical protein
MHSDLVPKLLSSSFPQLISQSVKYSILLSDLDASSVTDDIVLKQVVTDLLSELVNCNLFFNQSLS